MESLSSTLSEWLKPELIWFVAGLILLLAEFASPGIIIVFFGIGAWLVALITLFLGISINLQLIIFLVSSLVLLSAFRRKFKDLFLKQTEELDETESEFIGRKAVVIAEIKADKAGTVEFRGTTWEAEAAETIAVGKTVEIIDKNSITLKVKAL